MSISLLALLMARSATAQRARCNTRATPTTHITGTTLPSGETIQYAGGGIYVDCPSKGITLHSDSAEIYSDNRVFLLGNVDYKEPRFAMTSDFLTYYLADERILAAGNVNARLPSGSTLVGPQAEYRRAVPRVRARAQLLAPGRPTVTIVQRDASGKTEPPINVIANTIFMDGDSLIYGGGQVEIIRPELNAKADSAFISTGQELMQLMRNPVVEGTRGRPFKLVGERIDVFAKQRKVQRILSRANAVATSRDLTLNADTIDLRVANDLLERAYAWGPGRARARSPEQNLLADSLDVLMPSQRVREVRAVRHAFAEGKADTLKFRADTTNWMRGDTIHAYFDTIPPKDTTKGPAIQRLVAVGNASSYYHLAPTDTTLRRAAISYVTGNRITITFNEQRLAAVAVAGPVAGMHLEPSADTTRTGPPAAPGRRGGQPGAPRTNPPRTTPVVPTPATPIRRP